MKLDEALTSPGVVDGTLWFRPVGWIGPHAFTVQDGVVLTVPTSRGGHPGIIPYASVLAGEWEVVTPGQVLDYQQPRDHRYDRAV